MRNFLLILIGLVAGTAAAQPHTAQLLAAEDARFAAQVARDTAALALALHPELVYIHSNTLTESRADFIRSVAGGGIVYEAMTPEADRRVRWQGKRLALVDGTVAVQGLYQQNAFALRLRYTAVYVRARGRWQLLSWQSTRVPS